MTGTKTIDYSLKIGENIRYINLYEVKYKILQGKGRFI